jgi:hypothetical protein
MITFFTCPKAFTGHIGVIQRNAIRSWQYSNRGCEVILLGDEEGVKEFAEENNCKHFPGIEKKDGRPLISSIFKYGQELALNSFCCWINTDIILMDSFSSVIEQIKRALIQNSFLVAGERISLNIFNEINFKEDYRNIYKLAREKGASDGLWAIDYFLFPKGMYDNVPPFVIGCSSYDNWLIWYCKNNYIPVVNSSRVMLCIHQNHDHLSKGGFVHSFSGPVSQGNQALAQGKKKCLADSDYIFEKNGSVRAVTDSDIHDCDLQKFLENLITQAEEELLQGRPESAKDTLDHTLFCNEKPGEALQKRIDTCKEKIREVLHNV